MGGGWAVAGRRWERWVGGGGWAGHQGWRRVCPAALPPHCLAALPPHAAARRRASVALPRRNASPHCRRTPPRLRSTPAALPRRTAAARRRGSALPACHPMSGPACGGAKAVDHGGSKREGGGIRVRTRARGCVCSRACACAINSTE
jgi:hypothetical protein